MILAQANGWVPLVSLAVAVIAGPIGFMLNSWTHRGARMRGTEVETANLRTDHEKLSATVTRLDGIVNEMRIAFGRMEEASKGTGKLLDTVNARVGDVLKIMSGQHDRVREDVREVLRKIDHRKRNAAQLRQLKSDPDVETFDEEP